MSKTTMGNKLPRKLEQKMKVVGEQIKLARLRRNLSMEQVAERATCSPLTVSRIEKGVPTVAIGIYLRVLYALQLDDDIVLLAQKDEMGHALQDLALKHRERATKKLKKPKGTEDTEKTEGTERVENEGLKAKDKRQKNLKTKKITN